MNREQAEIRNSIRHNRKAWKYIQDITNAGAENLNRKALEDGSRQYTYGLMFHEWERYASVFSALNITGANHSRVGLLGSISAEAIFTIYGLNMVGAEVSLVPAYSALFTKKITETILNEKLTDFIVTDDFAQGSLINDLLETNMASHTAVDRCAVVPVMEKRIQDTVPVFYVVPTNKGQGAAESIREAFVDVYVKDKKIGADNIPTQFMLVEDIPLNANGKLDIFRITRERIGGEAYDLVPVFTDGELTDIQTKHVENVNSMTAGTVPHGMENHSAYNIFDLFNTAVPSGKTTGSSPHEPLGGFFEALFPSGDKSRTGGDMPEIPNHVREALLKYGNRLIGMIYTGRKSIDFDFEDDSER